MDEAAIRKKALERIKTVRQFKFENDYPPGVNMNDVFDAIFEVPIENLLTSNGDLTRRKVIIRRCIRYVASKGLVDEKKLRKDVVQVLKSFTKKLKLGVDCWNPIIHYFQYEASIEELIGLYDGRNINTDRLLRLADTQSTHHTID